MANVGQVLDHCYFCGIGFTKFEVSLPLIFTRKGCITNFWIILETVSGYLCRGTSFSASSLSARHKNDVQVQFGPIRK